MLTNEVEGNRLKCHPYWPRDIEGPVVFGDISVVMMGERTEPSWKLRTFTLINKKVSIFM